MQTSSLIQPGESLADHAGPSEVIHGCFCLVIPPPPPRTLNLSFVDVQPER